MTFTTIDNRRCLRAGAAWTILVFVLASSGCRCFQSNGTTTAVPPVSTPATILGSAPSGSGAAYIPPSIPPAASGDRSAAFLPITPDHLVTKEIVHSAPSESRETVDALNNRIADLEKALAESEEKLRETRLSAAPISPVPPVTTFSPSPEPEPLPFSEPLSESPPEPLPAVAATVETNKPIVSKPLPAINVSGVSVSGDGDCIRIEIPDTVLFTTGTCQLNAESEESLRKIAGEIRANDPDAALEIEGHTDNLDVDPKNKTQKHDMASFKSMVVMQYFVKTLLWDSSKITSSSFGPSRPVADNGTPEGRARNNRIEIVVRP